MPAMGLWITSKEASERLSERYRRPISQAYVRRLANTNRIKVRPIHARTKLYNRRDVELIQITKRGERRQKEEVSL